MRFLTIKTRRNITDQLSGKIKTASWHKINRLRLGSNNNNYSSNKNNWNNNKKSNYRNCIGKISNNWKTIYLK